MSTLDATFSMLEMMPEEDRIKVLQYTKSLYTSKEKENPFTALSTEQILSELEESRRQADEGKCYNMEDALVEMGRHHGFV